MATEPPKALTDEQKAVVAAGHSSFVVRASAGTGKTTTLVARYLRLVQEDGLRPDQILTVTFTRKAAAEMKHRIVGALVEAGLRDEAQIAETGPIQTIHGFCERILRECSVEAGLDPDFKVLDETESSRRLKAAIQASIGSLSEMPLAEGLLEHLAGKPKYRGRSPHALLEDAIGDAIHKLRGSTTGLEELKRQSAGTSEMVSFWRERIVDSLPLAVREAMAAIPPGPPFGVRLSQAFRAAKEKAPSGLPGPAAAELAEKQEAACAAHSCGLLQLASRAWEAYEAENAADRAVDFVELERRAVELLQTTSSARERLRRQYRAALLDESQDMNPIQHRLIEALGVEQEMLVGDAQQSIYGFRQADVRLFEERAGRSPTLQLSSNKRSRQPILRFVDALFSQVWTDRYVPMAEEAEGAYEGIELWIQRAKDTAQVAEWIESVVLEEGAGNVAVLTRAGRYAQELLGRLESRKVPARIIGGSERYYTRLEVRDLSNLLTALLDPANDFALLAVLRSPLAGASLDSVILLAAMKDVWTHVKEFEPPVAQDRPILDEFLAWFEPLSKEADRLPAWEILSEVLAQSPYLVNLAKRQGGIQTIANVRKLASIAAGMPDMDAETFARRIREIREIRHHEGDAPAGEDDKNQVSILTIHKAKGLEFPVVVVPETHSKEPAMGEIEVDRRSGMLTTKFGEGASVYHAMNTYWRKLREREELYRLLYVALTRAQRRLCIVADPAASNTKLAGDIVEKLGWRDGIPNTVRVREPFRLPSEGDSDER